MTEGKINFLNNNKSRIIKKKKILNKKLFRVDYWYKNYVVFLNLKFRKKLKTSKLFRLLAFNYKDRKKRARKYGSPRILPLLLRKIMFLYEFSILRYITARCLFDKISWPFIINKLNFNAILYIRFDIIILRLYTQFRLIRLTYQRVCLGLSSNNFLLFVTDYKETEFNMLKVVEGLKEIFITQIGWASGLLSNLKFMSLFFDFMGEYPEQVNKDRQYIKKVRTVTNLYKVPLVTVIMSNNYEVSFKETVIIKSDCVLVTNASFDYNNPIIYPVIGNINSMCSTFFFIELYKIAAKVGMQANKMYFINKYYILNYNKFEKNVLVKKVRKNIVQYLRAKADSRKINSDLAKEYSLRYNLKKVKNL